MTAEVKARVPTKMKNKVERIAKRRMVSSSDLVREALDDLIRKHAKLANPKAA